jgi:hypothetical protein
MILPGEARVAVVEIAVAVLVDEVARNLDPVRVDGRIGLVAIRGRAETVTRSTLDLVGRSRRNDPKNLYPLSC